MERKKGRKKKVDRQMYCRSRSNSGSKGFSRSIEKEKTKAKKEKKEFDTYNNTILGSIDSIKNVNIVFLSSSNEFFAVM